MTKRNKTSKNATTDTPSSTGSLNATTANTAPASQDGANNVEAKTAARAATEQAFLNVMRSRHPDRIWSIREER